MKVFRFVSIFCLLSISSCAFAGPMFVIDNANIANTGKLLKEAEAQIAQLKSLKDELQNVQSLLGSSVPDLDSLSAKSWLQTIQGYTSINIDSLSTLNKLGYQNLSTDYNDIQKAVGFLKNEFYPKNFESATFDERSQARKIRVDAARISMVSGVAVAAKHKHRLTESQKEITNLSLEGKKSADVLSALRVNNQLLSVMASEIVQQREMMAHLLEMLATHYAAQDGTIDLSSEAARKR